MSDRGVTVAGMEVHVAFGRGTTSERRADVLQAFATEGLSSTDDGASRLKAAGAFEFRLDVAFVLTAAVAGVIGNAAWATLGQGVEVLRRWWTTSGMVTVQTEAEVPTVYLVPGEPNGDDALEAIPSDAESGATGIRVYIRRVGWVDPSEALEIAQSAGAAVRAASEEEPGTG